MSESSSSAISWAVAELPIKGETVSGDADGIAHKFAGRSYDSTSPQDLDDQILRENGKGTDDALVLVARYQGGRS